MVRLAPAQAAIVAAAAAAGSCELVVLEGGRRFLFVLFALSAVLLDD
jgi:hypothetical protein